MRDNELIRLLFKTDVIVLPSELSTLVPDLALTPIMGQGPLTLLITNYDNSNSFYGQQSARGTEFAIFLANLAEYCSRFLYFFFTPYRNFLKEELSERVGRYFIR